MSPHIPDYALNASLRLIGEERMCRKSNLSVIVFSGKGSLLSPQECQQSNFPDAQHSSYVWASWVVEMEISEEILTKTKLPLFVFATVTVSLM